LNLITLFALFPCRWEDSPESEGLGLRLGWRWTALLQAEKSMEKALFLSAIGEEEPGAFPLTWRRFIRVGSSLPEQVANLFELCYEKGYERVIFAETISAGISDAQMAVFLAAANDCELAVLPAEDGSVLMASMQMHIFAAWSFFRFHASAAVVEMLSECHDKNISYRLLEPVDSSIILQDLRALLENTRKPETF
jgi:hypothetical protein